MAFLTEVVIFRAKLGRAVETVTALTDGPVSAIAGRDADIDIVSVRKMVPAASCPTLTASRRA
ncbi:MULTISPECIES: hypothetical protein [Inquilinus]|uniref:Uncharacterized protein n=1 Tax=Inquilinus ginsengisoli TaxID=363840 RepID=A0ABU1K119_9PROT|nr:hypothetical protein [Inquilinus ginsengisoli]MDR6294579.1 hypothetical protein [Inquilinus ginsengisoli]